MLNNKVFNDLKSAEKTVVINDMLTLKSYIPDFKKEYSIVLEIRSGYKLETAIVNSYILESDSLDSMINSIRESIEKYSNQIKMNMIREFNVTR